MYHFLVITDKWILAEYRYDLQTGKLITAIMCAFLMMAATVFAMHIIALNSTTENCPLKSFRGINILCSVSVYLVKKQATSLLSIKFLIRSKVSWVLALSKFSRVWSPNRNISSIESKL
jgi:hypothetical protein